MKVPLRAWQLIICYYYNARGQLERQPNKIRIQFAPSVTRTSTQTQTQTSTSDSFNDNFPDKASGFSVSGSGSGSLSPATKQKICQLPATTKTTTTTNTLAEAALSQSCLFIANIVDFLATKHIKTYREWTTTTTSRAREDSKRRSEIAEWVLDWVAQFKPYFPWGRMGSAHFCNGLPWTPRTLFHLHTRLRCQHNL